MSAGKRLLHAARATDDSAESLMRAWISVWMAPTVIKFPGLKDLKDSVEGSFHEVSLGRRSDFRVLARGDMFGAARAQDLSGVQRGAARTSDAMGSGRFADCVAALEARLSPGVDRQSAVHVLIVDCEFQRIFCDVVFVVLVEFDGQRVHLAETVEGFFKQSAGILEVGVRVGIELHRD